MPARRDAGPSHGYTLNCIAPVAFHYFRYRSHAANPNGSILVMSPFKSLLRVAGAVCLAAALSGCIIAPAYGPYYHPHHHYYGY
jgi:hypothetical protein